MGAGWRIVAIAGIVLACSRQETRTEAEPTASAARSVTTPAPSAALAEPEKPRFRKLRAFEAATFFAVGRAGIVCEGGCVYSAGSKPKVWLLENGQAREAPELWPAHAWERYLPALKEEDDGTAIVSYYGSYPNQLFASTDSGGRTWPGLPRVKFHVEYWVEVDGASGRASEDDVPPRRFDRALLTAPVTGSPVHRLVFGAGGPTLIAAAKQLHVWDGKAWSTSPAPWTDVSRGLRLKTGATLVTADNGAFLLDKDRRIVPVGLETKDTIASHVIGGQPWLISKKSSDLMVFVPEPSEKLDVAAKEPREPPPDESRRAPAPPASMDAAVAVDSDASPEKAEMPAPLPFSEACKTPFVLLATPPRPGHRYEQIGKGLAGSHQLAPVVTFVEYVRAGTTYFGAQAEDEASARKTIELAKSRIPGLRPQLVCLDAKSRIPDPYDPPEGMRIVFLHLGSGTELRLR